MNKPMISIIVLTYKKFDDLEKNIKSIFKQTYPNLEIIVSDDGSDNFNINYIKNLVDKRPKNIKNIKIIHHEKNVGTVAKNINNTIKKFSFIISSNIKFCLMLLIKKYLILSRTYLFQLLLCKKYMNL